MEIVIELPQDVNKLCRTCMNILKTEDKKNDIFDEENQELLKKLKFVVCIEISIADGLPRYLCTDCVKKLDFAHNFKQQSQETHVNFLGFLNHSHEDVDKEAIEPHFICEVCLQGFESQYRLCRHEIEHFKDDNLTNRFLYDNVDNKELIKTKIENADDISDLVWERKNASSCDEQTEIVDITPSFNTINTSDQSTTELESFSGIDFTETNEIKVCDICGRNFASTLQLTLHFINHALIAESDTDPDIFQQYFFCSSCGETFDLRDTLEAHVVECNQTAAATYKCEKCERDFENEIDLLNHDSESHENSFNWNDVFVKSVEKTDYICPLCTEKCSSKHDLTVHSVKHVLKHVNCRICKRTFCSQIACNNHLKTHPNYKYVCELCGRCLGSRHALKTHIMGIHSIVSNYTCLICSKKFKTPSRLYIHKLTHKKDKRYDCTVCGYKTNNLGDLKVHNRTHTSERPYKCNFVNCNRQFKTSSHLNEHIQRHLQIKRFRCETCEMVFGHSHSLKMHMMVHTGEKPFQCEICHLKFRRKHHLKNHMKQHGVQGEDMQFLVFNGE